jgi:hypothetical protein
MAGSFCSAGVLAGSFEFRYADEKNRRDAGATDTGANVTRGHCFSFFFTSQSQSSRRF